MNPSQLPNFEKGIAYWESVDASVDGVLGGFGEGPLPRVEQLGSRLFLLSLLPQLQSFPSPLSSVPRLSSSSKQKDPSQEYRYQALDVGAGVGRVTAETLLPLIDDVICVEPVKQFIETAVKECSEWRHLKPRASSSSYQKDDVDEDEDGMDTATSGLGNTPGPRVHFIQSSLQNLDPSYPLAGKDTRSLGVYGGIGGDERFGERWRGVVGYDVIWCQWCLGHLDDPSLVEFLKKAKRALRHLPPSDSPPANSMHPTPAISSTSTTAHEEKEELSIHEKYPSVIVVKENMCLDGPDGEGRAELDEEDSSLTRSNALWLKIFEDAGLKLVKEQVQEGLPAGLFAVKMFALR